MSTTLQQRMYRRYDDVKNSKWKIHVKGAIEDELLESQNKCHILAGVVQVLLHQLPDMQPKLDMMMVQISLANHVDCQIH
jgi:hypothetical protein